MTRGTPWISLDFIGDAGHPLDFIGDVGPPLDFPSFHLSLFIEFICPEAYAYRLQRRASLVLERTRCLALQRYRSLALQCKTCPALQRKRFLSLRSKSSLLLQRQRSPVLQHRRSPALQHKTSSVLPHKRSLASQHKRSLMIQRGGCLVLQRKRSLALAMPRKILCIATRDSIQPRPYARKVVRHNLPCARARDAANNNVAGKNFAWLSGPMSIAPNDELSRSRKSFTVLHFDLLSTRRRRPSI